MKPTAVPRYASVAGAIVQLNVKLALKTPKREVAAWVRRKAEQLGPTYIKLGQFVSSRRDIFGEEVTTALASLRDNVAPARVDGVDDPRIDDFDPVPLASASIGQVHTATLRSNKRRIIAKITRPHVGTLIQQDLAFVRGALQVMQWCGMQNIDDTIDLVNNFESNVLEEVQMSREAANMRDFQEAYGELEGIKIPRLYENNNNNKKNNILIMEYVPSTSVLKFGDAKFKKEMAAKLMTFFVRQLVVEGLVHGDPHDGNMGVLPDGSLVLYDFGNVVRVSEQERQVLKEVLYYLVVRNKQGVIQSLKELGIQVLDEALLSKYIDLYIEYLQTIDFTKFTAGMLEDAPTHNMQLPLKLNDKIFRLIRVFGILEGTCKQLDPEFNYFDVLGPELLIDETFVMYKAQKDLMSLLPTLFGRRR